MMEEIPNRAPIMPMNIGLFSRGRIPARITVEPAVIPAAPIPAIARPMMKETELGAPPDSAEPISKMTTEMR